MSPHLQHFCKYRPPGATTAAKLKHWTSWMMRQVFYHP